MQRVKERKGAHPMKQKIEAIRDKAFGLIKEADTLKSLEDIRVAFLGKKGELTLVLREMGKLTAEERPLIGKLANEARQDIENFLEEVALQLKQKEKEEKLNREIIDITVPGKKITLGRKHPITQTTEKIIEIFLGLGYQIAEGPEIETVYHNFDALNAPEEHPSRDEQDTFYINDLVCLRTQTSPVQIRVMQSQKPPIKIICPGRVYRSDDVDATHSPIFHQVEGLVVDKGVTMGDLVGTLKLAAKSLFGETTDIRLRPHHFPFTEPSAEVDVTCWTCGGKGCKMCKFEGWVEILGAGMVHPNVLRNCGLDPDIYTGFAFGMGIDRVAMSLSGINDMRLLFENDLRFLKQF
jgi:phenylalanyl-tRNA synthetase alpha chain